MEAFLCPRSATMDAFEDPQRTLIGVPDINSPHRRQRPDFPSLALAHVNLSAAGSSCNLRLSVAVVCPRRAQ